MDRTSSSGKDRAAVSGAVSNGDGEFQSSPEDPGISGGKRRGLFGVPLWVWVLVLCSLISGLLLALDLRNRDRYLMVCKGSAMELHRGRRFPWPLGHEVVGGAAFRPVVLPVQADCRGREFASEVEATRGFLDFLLTRVRADLEQEQGADLKRARRHTLQALMLSRGREEIRAETNRLLAEVDYREGRNSLARVEAELRTALSRFREAKKLGGTRHKDLAQWITHLELLLASIAPRPGPLPFPGKGGQKKGKVAPDAGAASPAGKAPVKKGGDAGPAAPDAGVIPEKDPGGILL